MSGVNDNGFDNMEAYERLANAIVIKAAKDYRRALKKHFKNRNNLDAIGEIESIERFFRSTWFGVLTSIDPELLIRRLNEEV